MRSKFLEIAFSSFGFTKYSGRVQSVKGFTTLRNVVNLQFVAEVRAEVVRDVSRSARVV